MLLYRATSQQYLEVYNGMGGSYREGGRWNRRGQPVMYFALSPAVARLEMANYLPAPDMVPEGYRIGEYRLDTDAVSRLNPRTLPDDWMQYPYPRSTQQIGGMWLLRAEEAVLLAPSVTDTLNVDQIAMVNPLHPDVRSLQLLRQTDVLYSDRMFNE